MSRNVIVYVIYFIPDEKILYIIDGPIKLERLWV